MRPSTERQLADAVGAPAGLILLTDRAGVHDSSAQTLAALGCADRLTERAVRAGHPRERIVTVQVDEQRVVA